MDELFSYHSLVHAVAGMCGGACAITAFYPLNVLRTRLQVSESKKVSPISPLLCDAMRCHTVCRVLCCDVSRRAGVSDCGAAYAGGRFGTAQLFG